MGLFIAIKVIINCMEKGIVTGKGLQVYLLTLI